MQSILKEARDGKSVIELHSEGGEYIATIDDVVIVKCFRHSQDKPIHNGIRDCYRLLWKDWNVLTVDEKISCGSPVWMFDEEDQDWYPQTELYTGG